MLSGPVLPGASVVQHAINSPSAAHDVAST